MARKLRSWRRKRKLPKNPTRRDIIEFLPEPLPPRVKTAEEQELEAKLDAMLAELQAELDAIAHE